MRVLAAFLIIGLFLPPRACAGDEGIAGNWKVSILQNGNQTSYWLILFSNKGGKLDGKVEVLDKVPNTTLHDAKITGDLLEFTLKLDKGPTFNFEGKVPKAGAKKIFGSLARGNQITPAIMEATAAKNAFELHRDMVIRTPNDPRVFETVMGLIGQAKEHKVPAKDVQEWVETVMRTADNFGPRWQLELAQQLIDSLLAEDGYGAVAVETARQAVKMLDVKAPADTRLRVLTSLGTALKQTGQTEQAKEVNARIDLLESEAYNDYVAKSQEFKVAKYLGRKSKSNHAVLVELFTGAQCPPCVGADLAFDALPRAYDSKDVVLLQYHLHVPRADALTNPDAEARAEYYGDEKVRGTPTVLFDGKVAPVGGGPREDTEELFKDYRRATEQMLETPAAAQLQASATRKGDKVSIKATVQDLDKPGLKIKLRLALVENWARYKGSNGLSYYHHVVRAFPGGVGGMLLSKKDAEQTAEIDLNDLRQSLTKYLDKAGKEQPFPDMQRPMRFRNLTVVAFIQNDATQQVLQATQVEVKEE